MLQQDYSKAPCSCPICECPVTFIEAAKDAPLATLIEEYNHHFSEDLRTQIIHQKKTVSPKQVTVYSSGGKKVPKLIGVTWRIIETCKKQDPESRILKLVKPEDSTNTSELATKNLPIVRIQREEKFNPHAFKIMHFLSHKNLVHMLAADYSEERAGCLDTFLEPTSGKLLSLCSIQQCVDGLYHIPSNRFRSFVREMFSGTKFLKEHSLYHGDLSWATTLYTYNGSLYTVKLAGFRRQGSMTIEGAQTNDCNCLADMLRHRVQAAIAQDKLQIFCGHIEGLITALGRTDLTSKEIMDNTFFWDEEKRISFYTGDVSLKIKDEKFQLMILHSTICAVPWDKSTVASYMRVVIVMNNYRINNDMLKYDFKSKTDFVKCVCGAYAHRRELEMPRMDMIIREAHPDLSIVLKQLVERFDSEGFECPDEDCEICACLWGKGQMEKLLQHKFGH
ncbi:hypothetical protein ACQJBY_028424 [Aegilops geniculata]